MDIHYQKQQRRKEKERKKERKKEKKKERKKERKKWKKERKKENGSYETNARLTHDTEIFKIQSTTTLDSNQLSHPGLQERNTLFVSVSCPVYRYTHLKKITKLGQIVPLCVNLHPRQFKNLEA